MSDSTASRPDRRIDRSQQALTAALLGLIQERDWSGISVQMICDRANVARSTFYAHYATRQDLLDAVFAAGEAELAQMSQGGLDATVLWLARHLETAVGFHRRLQGSQAGLVIMARFRRLMRSRLAEALAAEGRTPTTPDLDLATGGVFSALENWLLAGCRDPAAPLAASLCTQIRRCIPVTP